MSDEQFGRHMRLVEARDYRRVFADSRKSSDQSLTVLARRNGKAFPRLGLAIARKHVRTAVARNRIKRIVRESFRQHRAKLRGLDIVVMARPEIACARNASLRKSLERHWTTLARKCKGGDQAKDGLDPDET